MGRFDVNVNPTLRTPADERIIHLNGIFPYKPAILGLPHLWKPLDVHGQVSLHEDFHPGVNVIVGRVLRVRVHEPRETGAVASFFDWPAASRVDGHTTMNVIGESTNRSIDLDTNQPSWGIMRCQFERRSSPTQSLLHESTNSCILAGEDCAHPMPRCPDAPAAVRFQWFWKEQPLQCHPFCDL